MERARREPERIYAGAGAPPPRCTAAGGRVSARRLGPLRIGDSEEEARRALGPPQRVKRGFLRWCVEGGGRLLAGQRGDRSGELGAGGPRRTVMALTTSPAFRYRGVGPGSSRRALLRALARARRAFRHGRTAVYVAPPRAALIAGVRGGRVGFLAVRDRRAVRGKRSLRGYLRRARR